MARKPCDECNCTNHSNHDLHLLNKKKWRDKNRQHERLRKRIKGYNLKERYPDVKLYQITQKEWLTLLDGECYYCNSKAESIDHIIPLSRGGQHSIGNIVGACLWCNKSKGTKTIMEWLMSDARIGTRAWRKVRDQILERDGWTCHYCRGEANTVDHIVPRKLGGTNEPSNLVAACVRCNSSKGARTAPRKPFFGNERTRPPAGAVNSPMRRIGPDGQEFETE